MKNFARIAGIVLLVIGTALAVFTSIPIADYIGIAVDALGLTLLVATTLKKPEKRTWKEVVAVILFIIGGALCGLAGIAESTMTQLITVVFGAVSLIVGLIVAFVNKKAEDKK